MYLFKEIYSNRLYLQNHNINSTLDFEIETIKKYYDLKNKLVEYTLKRKPFHSKDPKILFRKNTLHVEIQKEWIIFILILDEEFFKKYLNNTETFGDYLMDTNYYYNVDI